MAKSRKTEPAPKPQKLRVHGLIDAEMRRRLGAYAGANRITESQVIEDGLRIVLRGFYFGQREPSGPLPCPTGTESGEAA